MEQLLTKQISIEGLDCHSQQAFQYVLKKYVFSLVIQEQNQFAAMGLKNEYIHESVQQNEARKEKNKDLPKEQKISHYPVLVNAFYQQGKFNIIGYGKKGIACLDLWLCLFNNLPSIQDKNLDISVLQSQTQIGPAATDYTYTCYNWVPFRNCKSINGFYYNLDKKPKQIANFETRLKKNLETFITKTCGLPSFDTSALWMSILKLEHTQKKVALNKQQKAFFKITFSCNYKLPSIFSLGQNVAYGNGVFFLQKTKPNELKKNYLQTSKSANL